jgi:hypothetical protein
MRPISTNIWAQWHTPVIQLCREAQINWSAGQPEHRAILYLKNNQCKRLSGSNGTITAYQVQDHEFNP